ncbi:hypothetical protein [Streptomyces sp. NPDC018045]
MAEVLAVFEEHEQQDKKRRAQAARAYAADEQRDSPAGTEA